MLKAQDVFEEPILVVDDNPANVLLLKRVLGSSGFSNVRGTTKATEVVGICEEWAPSLIILDLHMPIKDGYEVLKEIRSLVGCQGSLPVLIFTADVTSLARRKALEAGASDFITKPGDATEIVLRTTNFLQTRQLYQSLKCYADQLESMVHERTKELLHAQVEIVERLSHVSEYHDDETGAHAKRVGRLSSLIALKMGLNFEDASTLELAASLHDLGKIAIPDSILRKPGKLERLEFEQMKSHTLIGARILMGSRSQILILAEAIALSHHERWDGTGYPSGLAGEDIPLCGRICSVADSYDALISDRIYRRGVSHEAAVNEITRCSGSQFDPNVVEAFLSVVDILRDQEDQPLAA